MKHCRHQASMLPCWQTHPAHDGGRPTQGCRTNTCTGKSPLRRLWHQAPCQTQVMIRRARKPCLQPNWGDTGTLTNLPPMVDESTSPAWRPLSKPPHWPGSAMTGGNRSPLRGGRKACFPPEPDQGSIRLIFTTRKFERRRLSRWTGTTCPSGRSCIQPVVRCGGPPAGPT
jgi:hypothetical protein